MTALLYRRTRQLTAAAAISYEQSLITGQYRDAWARPADDPHAWQPISPAQLAALDPARCATPDEARAVLAGGVR